MREKAREKEVERVERREKGAKKRERERTFEPDSDLVEDGRRTRRTMK